MPVGVKGLDVDDGLSRAMGKRPLYLSMLGKFVAGQENVRVLIERALSASDWKTAERLAHTTKGGAGTIGAVEVQRAAAALEDALCERRPRGEIDSLLTALDRNLSPMIAALARVLTPDPPMAAQAQVVPEKLKTVCAQLEALLADNNAEVVTLMDTNADLLNAAFPAHCGQIADAIRRFDFERALAALRAANAVRAGV